MKNSTLFLAICILLSSRVSLAQAGSLDSTFSDDGKVAASFAIGQSSGNAVAIQQDGKIVVAGSNYTDAQYDICLARYQPDGTLDSSFGVNGRIVTDLHGSEQANAVAIRTDGKILVAGERWNGITDSGSRVDFVLVRYLPTGKLDRNFGELGAVITDFGKRSTAYSLAIQSSGKIIAAGYTFSSGGYEDYNFALARYGQDGHLDSSFGTDGKVITDFGPDNAMGYGIAIQSNGKIIMAGDMFNPLHSIRNFLLVRYQPNGQVDTSFGTDGKVVTDFGSYDWATSIALQADGKIVAAGTTSATVDSYTGFALARYKPNGNLDSAFGINGEVITDLKIAHQVTSSVAIQADGKILLAGTANQNFALLRYWRNGRLDQTFGVKGRVITDVGNARAECKSLALQVDGKMVVTGYSGSKHSKYVILRYNGDNTSVPKTGTDNFSNLQKEVNASSNIHFSPNPVKDILRIDGLSSSNKTISILDTKGRLLRQVSTVNSSYSFYLKQLPAGFYFLRIDEGQKNTTLRFIKE